VQGKIGRFGGALLVDIQFISFFPSCSNHLPK
jgi:hypothetical protein